MINNTVEEIRKHFESIMDLLNIERNSSNENTPLRVSKMLCNELFASRNNIGIAELDNQMKVFMCDWDESDSNAISIKDIPVHSMCFTGKTPIQTPSGVKYIKDFKVGDEVDTFNESGELETRKVTHVFKSKVDTIVKVPTSRGSSLTCTPNHPIFVLGKGWVEAKDLLKDDQIYCIRKGHNRLNRNPIYPDRVVESISGDVEYIKSRNVSYEVYNLEVQDNHTYIAKSVWVHNCEHHWLPMIGTCTVTYIPSDRVIGLSKVPRVVKYFSRKPQLQERLTTEIGEYLVSVLDPRYLSVSIDCEHMCVQMRGAEANCITSTFFDYEGK